MLVHGRGTDKGPTFISRIYHPGHHGDGAFYMFADVSGLTDNAQEFCQKMLAEAGVATTPGIDFDPVRGKQFLRFSIAGNFATMEEAARRLRIWHADRG